MIGKYTNNIYRQFCFFFLFLSWFVFSVISRVYHFSVIPADYRWFCYFWTYGDRNRLLESSIRSFRMIEIVWYNYDENFSVRVIILISRRNMMENLMVFPLSLSFPLNFTLLKNLTKLHFKRQPKTARKVWKLSGLSGRNSYLLSIRLIAKFQY